MISLIFEFVHWENEHIKKKHKFTDFALWFALCFAAQFRRLVPFWVWALPFPSQSRKPRPTSGEVDRKSRLRCLVSEFSCTHVRNRVLVDSKQSCPDQSSQWDRNWLPLFCLLPSWGECSHFGVHVHIPRRDPCWFWFPQTSPRFSRAGVRLPRQLRKCMRRGRLRFRWASSSPPRRPCDRPCCWWSRPLSL